MSKPMPLEELMRLDAELAARTGRPVQPSAQLAAHDLMREVATGLQAFARDGCRTPRDYERALERSFKRS